VVSDVIKGILIANNQFTNRGTHQANTNFTKTELLLTNSFLIAEVG